MHNREVHISRKTAWIFVFNAAICILSLVAEGIAQAGVNASQWFMNIAFSTTFVYQLGLLGLTVLTAFILTAIFDSRSEVLKELHLAMKTTQDFRDDLAKGIVRYEGQAYRSLRYMPDQGAIYYGDVNPDNRNILFNNETLKKIFQTAKQAKCGDTEVLIDGRPLIFALGFSASNRFSSHFQQYVEAKELRFDLATWLSEWASYDKNAGFGAVEVKHITSDNHQAIVVIRNSFLTHGSDYGGKESLCGFMQGYIEGLLKGFRAALYQRCSLDREGIRVLHDERTDCYHGHQDPEKGCVFHVQVPRLPGSQSETE